MKQAYLIMAHTNLNQLCRLVSALDYYNSDIYIHADKKWKDFDAEIIRKYCHQSNLYFVKRLDVVWGDYSQIECEMNLFSAAINSNRYLYLHLLSGFDFPLCGPSKINDFFEVNYPAQFVYFDRNNSTELALQRCKEYHLFQRYTGRRKNEPSLIKCLEDISLGIQRRLKINRNRKTIFNKYEKGANWVSITGDFAEYLMHKQKEIKRAFHHTVCCDEVFLHTVLKNSPFISDIYKSEIKDRDGYFYTNMVYTDWNRGRPYTFKSEDFEELISSPYIFARKFDENTDCDILEKIENYIKKG